jgi:hypothetical protein
MDSREESFLEWYRDVIEKIQEEDEAKQRDTDPASWFYWLVAILACAAMVVWPWW